MSTGRTTVRSSRSATVARGVRALVTAALLGVGLAAAYPAPAANADATFNQRMVTLINQARAGKGLPALVVHTQAGSIAENAPWSGCGFNTSGRAADMVQRNYFSHTIANCANKSVFDVMRSANISSTWAAENIGWSTNTGDPATVAQQLHNMFMNSAGHKANILSADATHVGVGSWKTAAGQTWSGAGAARSNVWVTTVVFLKTTTAVAPTLPSAPTNIGGVSPSSGTLDISWAKSSPNGATVDNYVAYAYTAAGFTGRYVFACGTCTTARITGLAPGVPHMIAMYAHNSVGWGLPGYSGWLTPR